MQIDIFGGYIYLIDSDSPLRAKHYHIIFEKGTKDEVVSVAKKLGLVEIDVSKSELIANIVKLLEDLNIKEPIKAIKLPKSVNSPTNLGNGNLPMNMGNGNMPMNLMNGNLPMNTGNGNLLMNTGNGNTPMNTGNGNLQLNMGKPPSNGRGAPNGRLNQNMPGMAKFSKQNEGNKGFRPGKPIPRGSLPGSAKKTNGTSSVNKNALLKRLNKIKNELGVFSLNGKPQPTVTQAVTGISRPMNKPTSSGATTVQHFYVGSQPPRTNASSSVVSGATTGAAFGPRVTFPGSNELTSVAGSSTPM
jgi:hypothetical protein